jgi:methyl-accepting chemotaxis protein
VSRLNLSARFTLILTAVFLVGILIAGTAYWRTLQGRAQDEIAAQGTILIEAMNAVRAYTTVHVRPLLVDELAASPEFIPETVPAFSARSVFDSFRTQADFETYRYKEAALDPTNPLDLADDFEAELLRNMISGATQGEVSGYRTQDAARLFYIARPLTIRSESCLECHSTPENAPASLIATYGDQAGFGWQVGQTVAAQIIYVPAQEVFDATWRTFTLAMSIFIIIFALLILLLNTLLRRYVIQPVDVLGGLARKISADDNFADDLESPALQAVTARPDELGHLAQVFKKMAADVHARTGILKQQVQQLIITIDQIRRNEQVSAVVDTEFFNELQNRARELRENKDEKEDDEGDGEKASG